MSASPTAFESAHQPGLQNISPGFFDTISKCGLCIVTVKIQYALTPLKQPEITDTINKALQEINAGTHDSSLYPGCLDEQFSGMALHFFHLANPELEKGVARIKAELERMGLLGISAVFQSESHDQFFIWWSPQSELIGQRVKPKWAE